MFQTESIVHPLDLRVKLSLLIINPGSWISMQRVERCPMTWKFLFCLGLCTFKPDKSLKYPQYLQGINDMMASPSSFSIFLHFFFRL